MQTESSRLDKVLEVGLPARSGRFFIARCIKARSSGTSIKRLSEVAPRSAGSETRRTGSGSMLRSPDHHSRTIGLRSGATLENQREGADHLSRRGFQVSAYGHGTVRALWRSHADCRAELSSAEGTLLRVLLLESRLVDLQKFVPRRTDCSRSDRPQVAPGGLNRRHDQGGCRESP